MDVKYINFKALRSAWELADAFKEKGLSSMSSLSS